MTKFELFCMIFYVLDVNWDETQDPIVGEYLSGANPFLFEDIGSADPAIYIRFCEMINDDITILNCYSIAKNYINALNCENITKAFLSISKVEWEQGISSYLSQEHRGGNC